MSENVLKNVELHITNLCTHKCPYCYLDAGLKIKPDHANLTTLYKVIDEIDKCNVDTISLLGGDPALHPNIIDILQYINEKTRINVAFMSNTMSIVGETPKNLAKLIETIDTTIHGKNAIEHDAFCKKKGAYNLLIKKLKLFSSLGVKINIAVNLIPDTYDKVYEIVKGLISDGVKINSLLIQRILPFGRAKYSNTYNINKKQLNIAFHQIAQVEETFRIGISVEDPYPLCCLEEKFRNYMHGCPEGRSRIAINGKGDVSRCGAVADYSMGNILTTPLCYLWDNAEEFRSFRNHKHLVIEECRKCDLRNICGGGCPISCELCNEANLNFVQEFYKE